MKTRTRRKVGLTLVEVMIIIALIGLLAAVINGCRLAKQNDRQYRTIHSALTNASPVGVFIRLTNAAPQLSLYDIQNLANAVRDYRVFKAQHPYTTALLVVSEEPSFGNGYIIWIPGKTSATNTEAKLEK